MSGAAPSIPVPIRETSRALRANDEESCENDSHSMRDWKSLMKSSESNSATDVALSSAHCLRFPGLLVLGSESQVPEWLRCGVRSFGREERSEVRIDEKPRLADSPF